jgi:polyhydroxybutyrate depolymerase
MKIRAHGLTRALVLAGIVGLCPVACNSDNGGGSANGGSQSTGGSTKPAGSGGSASGGTTTVNGSGGATSPSGSGGVGSGGTKSGGSTGSGGSAGGSPGSGGSSSGGATGSGGAAGTPGSGGSTAAGGKSGTGGVSVDGGQDAAAGGAGATGSGGANSGGTTSANGGAGATGNGGANSGGTTGANGGAGGGTSVACPATVLKSGDTTVTLQSGGLSRTYILHVPSAYKGTAAVPLIVDYHPIMGTATGEEGSSPFKAVTDPEGVITAYPQGQPSPLNNGAAWDVGPCCVANVDDVAFSKAIIADVESKACIDTKRIYAVGFSMGGGMSHYIACKAADVFAAVAPAAFDLLKGSAPKGNADDCKPARPIPVLSFRGTADGTALYAGGDSSVVPGMPITFLGAKACWEKWASINGCTDTPTYPTAGSTFQCSYYKQCKDDVQVGVCVNTGGHAYGDGTIGWKFLKQFTLP